MIKKSISSNINLGDELIAKADNNRQIFMYYTAVLKINVISAKVVETDGFLRGKKGNTIFN